MSSRTDTAALLTDGEASLSAGQAREPIAPRFDLVVALVLISVAGYGALYLAPYISGDHHPLQIPLLVGALIPVCSMVALSGIERLFPPAGPRKSLKSWCLHLQIHVLLVFMWAIAYSLGLLGLSAAARHFGFKLGLIDLRFAQGKSVIYWVAAAWLAAIVWDFFFYWFHLALHKSKVLWQHHKLHHMDRELEAITFSRQNWLEVFGELVAIAIPTAILFKVDDLDPLHLGLLAGISTAVFNILISLGHMNVRLQAGRASVIFCTPQMHRIHHSCLPEHQDKNFAFALPLWDVLFGTYYAPRWNEFPPTGVDGEQEFQSFWESQIFTQREWWRMFRAWRARRLSSPA